MHRTLLAALVALSAPSPALAEPRTGVHLDLPALDLPAATEGGAKFPTMAQSLAVSADVFSLAHFGLGAALDPYDPVWWKRLLGRTSIVGADLFLSTLPLGLSWEHEEWHRAVLSRRGIASRNDVWDFNLFSTTTSVSHVADADLARLKLEHPADFARLASAGFEGNAELALELVRTPFFHRTHTWNAAAIVELHVVNLYYFFTCVGPGADSLTDQFNREEGADVPRRDFTGLDCTAWAYDLSRPAEPYAGRGVHPSGVGVNRYRRFSDLSRTEQGWLTSQRNLMALNFLEPAMFGFESFAIDAGDRPLRFLPRVRHLPASFGTRTDLDVLFSRGPWQGELALQAYANFRRGFPGLSAEVYRLPLEPAPGWPVAVSARAMAWLQPEGQRFDTEESAAGGLLRVRATLSRWAALEPYLEAEAKSAGFVPGVVALEPGLAVRVGITSRPFGEVSP
jgi:hypothetical protein